MLRLINKTLQNVCGDKRPFGNKIMLLGGDFMQTLPIIKDAEK
jgi:hypothetical protein